jgi:hypothetical protein
VGLGFAAPRAAEARLDPEELRQDIITHLKQGFSAYSAESFDFVSVETRAKGDAVRVKITGISLPLADIKGRLDLGDLAFTLAEAGDRLYRVSEVEAASQAAMVGEKGEQGILINYDLERLEGIWSAALRNFLDLDLMVNRFEAVMPDANLAFAVDSIAATNRTSTRSDALTDMEGEMRATGIRMLNPAFGQVEIEEMSAEYTSQGQDLVAFGRFNDEFMALSGRETPPDSGALAQLMERLADINVLPRGFIERLHVGGLTYYDQARRPQFRVGGADMDFAAGDLHLAEGYGSMGIRYTGLEMATPEDQPVDPIQALVPGDFALILSVERLPVQALWQVVLKSMAVAIATGKPGEPNPQMQMMAAMIGMQMLNAFNQSKTRLRLDRFDMESPVGSVNAEGAIEADSSAPVGAKGAFKVAITGLDQMIAIVTNAAQSGQLNPQAQGNAAFLMILKSMGRRESLDNGTPVDRYDIVLTPAGQLTVNGQPFGLTPTQPQ